MATTSVTVREVAQLRRRGEFGAALLLLDSLDDHRPDVAYHRAWVLDGAERDEEAIRWYQRALKANARANHGELSADEHLGALLGLTMVLLRAGRPDHAQDVLRAASTRFPNSAQVAALQPLVDGRLASHQWPAHGAP